MTRARARVTLKSAAHRVAMRMPTLALRAKERVDQYRPDVEIRQLLALQAAYSAPDGPELLIFGDSAMVWCDPRDGDQRNLAQMIRDAVGSDLRYHLIAGPGYNARLASAFLTALRSSPCRPKVVIVPTSLLMASPAWIEHPKFGYMGESARLRELATAPDHAVKRLPRADHDDFNKYDKLPAASLFGARRTYGELRLITDSAPTSRWQQTLRLRHLLDYINAEKLDPAGSGMDVIAESAELLASLDVPGVAYIAPTNVALVEQFFGPAAVEHVRGNAQVVREAFLRTGIPGLDVTDATFLCAGAEFGDLAHLTHVGRRKLAKAIADTTQKLLEWPA